MEKYKFRGKSLNTGEWVYGSLLQINGMSFIHPSETGELDDCINFGWSFVEVLKESVGQFIGLTDKNGVEIYQKDLFKLGEINKKPFYGEIVFDNAGDFGVPCFCILSQEGHKEVFYDVGDESRVWFEVIGNTIDNPELLNA